MDSFSLGAVLKIMGDFGIVGLVIFLWWSDNKRIWAVIDEHKKDMADVLDRYQHDMAEQREMYKNNASLCRDFSEITKEFEGYRHVEHSEDDRGARRGQTESVLPAGPGGQAKSHASGPAVPEG